MSTSRSDDTHLTWEDRLRALDEALAQVGARVDDPLLGGPSRPSAPDDAPADAPATHAELTAPPVNEPRLERTTVVGRDGDHDADRLDTDRPDAGPRTALADLDEADDEADEVETAQQAASRRRRALLDWVVVIGVALIVAFLVRTFVLAHFVVDGTSMASTLHDGDRVFVNKLSYRLHDPNRGDVVVLHEIRGTSDRDLIKRVIALPGETIEVRNCEVTIDGKKLEEPYLDPPATTPGTCGRNVDALVVPEDHVFVMGDNRGGSMDSRDLGPISEDDLVGRAFVVFWPFDNWQWL